MATTPKGRRNRKPASSPKASQVPKDIPRPDKTLGDEGKPLLDKQIYADFLKMFEDQRNKYHEDVKYFKDHKNEHKEHKHEYKEFKIEKIERPEFDVPIYRQWPPHLFDPLGGTPWNPGDPIPDNPMQLWAMAAGLGSAGHFIRPEDRPDLGSGALSQEEDQRGPKQQSE